MIEIFRNNRYVILSYGFFLGWLLSFPYNGPILELLNAKYGLSTPSLALVFTITPALFLIAFSILVKRESFCRPIMVTACIGCMTGTLVVFMFDGEMLLYFPFAVMGICCVLFIPAWSYFYTYHTKNQYKMQVMALVIITGNIIYYAMNLLIRYLPFGVLCIILTLILSFSLLFSLKIDKPSQKSLVIPRKKRFPGMLVFSICIFMFAINLNGGMMFQSVYPYFRQYEKVPGLYTMFPYIATLCACFYLLGRLSKTFPLYLGTVLLGISYLSFSAFGPTAYSFFLVETFAQAGWALIDLFLWTMLGEVAAFFGNPLKISGYGLMSNLFSVFTGGVIGLRLYQTFEEPHFLTGLLAVFIVLITVLLLPFLAQQIKAFAADVDKAAVSKALNTPITSTSMNLPGSELLTAREAEIAALLSDGISNKEIATHLSISENTLKIHARRIYAKLGVSNKKELFQKIIRQSKGST